MAAGMLFSAAALAVLTLSGSWLVFVPAFAVTGVRMAGRGSSMLRPRLRDHQRRHPRGGAADEGRRASGIVLTGLLIAAALAVTLAASLVEEFHKRPGPAAEGAAVNAVLRIAASLSAAAAVLLLVALRSSAPAPAAPRAQGR